MKKLITILTLAISSVANAQYYQMGPKFTETVLTTNAGYGYSTSLSADGYTAIVGAPAQQGNTGAAYVYARAGSSWSLIGTLVGTGAIGAAYQGQAVALSADGNTAIVGGPGDDNNKGAAWIFVRSGNTWTQQAKLVGTGVSGSPVQGFSVSLSGNGNIAIVGGPDDNSGLGAAWVFSRNGNNWSQVGTKLVGSGANSNSTYPANQGCAVDVSDNGNTIIIGGMGDAAWKGAVWIFQWSNNTWQQEGSKAPGTFGMYLGASVSINSAGDRAVVGTPGHTSNYGGAFVLARQTNGSWTQEGNQLVGNFPIGNSQQGGSVSMDAAGENVVIGGGYTPFNSSDDGEGQLWVFSRSGNTWTQTGNKIVGTGSAGNARQGTAVAISGDAQTIITGGYADDNYKGAVWLFNTTPASAENIESMHGMEVYPNPAVDEINIRTSVRGDLEVSILDMQGRKVLIKHLQEANRTVSLSELTPGLYYVLIHSGSQVAKYRLVKQ